MVSSTHEQNSICSQKKLNAIAHEHTIICRQLFAGHVVGSRPMKRKKHLHRMIITLFNFTSQDIATTNAAFNREKGFLFTANNSSLLIHLSDEDECALGTHSCDVNAYCNNTMGSYNCTCYPEYTGNGTSCTGKFLYNTSIFLLLLLKCYSLPSAPFLMFKFESFYVFYLVSGGPSFCPHVLTCILIGNIEMAEILKHSLSLVKCFSSASV